MNLRLLQSGLPHGIERSLPFWQLPLKPRWVVDRVESPAWSLTQIAVVGWIIGFTGAVLFHLAWPGITPFRANPESALTQSATPGAFQ